jgi:hypothetical protein
VTSDCAHVRELLPEWAVGVLPRDDRSLVREHLAWCAGCRHEAGELADGASAVVLATEAPEPPPELEERVVGAVTSAAGRRRSRTTRAGILLAASLALLLGGLAGAMAERFREPALGESAGRAERRLDEFERLLSWVGAGDRVLTAPLVAAGEGEGAGRAVVYDSPGSEDFAVVVVGGLRREDGPYWATIQAGGGAIGIGRLEQAEPGQFAAYRLFSERIHGYRELSVQDRRGEVVLTGTLTSARQ